MKQINPIYAVVACIFLCFENGTTAQNINPYSFLASLQFDGCDLLDAGESNFPMSFNFNTTQDANNDLNIDAEDNLENLILYSIDTNQYGIGRTGLTGRGPNDQSPAVYFHYVSTATYDVYEYWLYYADNNWLNDHEHDWEKYFVYVHDTTPFSLMISTHDSYSLYAWEDIVTDQMHPVIGVDGGSHAMKNAPEDGVCICYDGSIYKNNGTLLTADSLFLPWTIFSNDSNVLNSTSYIQYPDTFYYGDPSYLTNNNEWGDPRAAPWLREEWSDPPEPIPVWIHEISNGANLKVFPNPANNFLYFENNGPFNMEVKIFSSDGRIVLSQSIYPNSLERINISRFEKGIYLLWAEDNLIFSDRKIIVF